MVGEFYRAGVQMFVHSIVYQLDGEQETVVRRELEEKGYDVVCQQDYLTGYRHALLRLRYLLASS